MSVIDHYVMLHSFLKYDGRFLPVENMEEAIKLVKERQIKAEIIGTWLYCYTTDLIGFQLLALGFWYSRKHGVFIYSGGPKEPFADDETLDEIKARLGTQKV